MDVDRLGRELRKCLFDEEGLEGRGLLTIADLDLDLDLEDAFHHSTNGST